MLENLAVDTELRLLGLWKEVRPEGCFSALYKDISNYMILVIRRGFFFCLTFSKDCYQFTCNEEKKVIFLLPSPLDFVDLLKRDHEFVCV